MITEDINFTPRSQKLLQATKRLALSFNHDTICLAHLFAAFFELKQSKSLEIVKGMGVDLDRLKKVLYEDILEKLPNIMVSPETVKLSKVIVNILKQSTEIATEFRHSWVSVDHIFLVLLDNLDKWPRKVVSVFNIDLAAAFTEIVTYLSDTDISETNIPETQPVFTLPHAGAFPDVAHFKVLSQYASNLTQKVLAGKIDPIFGRETETAQLEDILNRRKKNSALLLGEAGVGKTSIVEGLVQRIVSGNAPLFLQNKIVFSLDLNTIVAGTKYRGEFEDRLNKIIEEAKHPNVILFIDEVPTNAEYRKKLFKDKALHRRFEQVFVEEPTKEETLKILHHKKQLYEEFHYVSISDKMLSDIVDYSEEFLTNSQFPDKAIDLLDLICSHVKIKKIKKPSALQNLEREFVKSLNENATPREEQNTLFERMKTQAFKWSKAVEKKRYKIAKRDLFEILSRKTDIPCSDFIQSASQKYTSLSKNLKKVVFGQSHVIDSISRCLLRHKSGLRDTGRPIGSFMFLGPTGVGKTYVSKCLASNFFKSKHNFIQLDMSEFSESASISKLIGSSPGYVGFEEGGLLVEQISKHPSSVVLFDEIEKAHPKIHQILLQILEEGHLHDSHGRDANFRNSIIIVTGNIASKILTQQHALGFVDNIEETRMDDAKKHLKKVLPLELINRFDEIIFFNKLSDDNLKAVVGQELQKLTQNALKNGITVNFSASLEDFILNCMTDKSFGARSIKRTVQNKITDILSLKFIKNPKVKEYSVSVSKNSDKINVEF